MVTTPFLSLYRAEQLTLLEQQRYLLSKEFAVLFTVVFFCAEWCAVCRDFTPICQQTAARYRKQYTDTLFILLDIEDDEALIGTLTIDNFPMMAVFRNNDLIQFSTIRAREDALINSLKTSRNVSRILGSHPELLALRQTLFAYADHQETTVL